MERYGVHFDPALRDEIVARVDRLDMPSYTAFVMPRLTATRDATGAIADVAITYPCDLTAQMLEYSAATADVRGDTAGMLPSPADGGRTATTAATGGGA